MRALLDSRSLSAACDLVRHTIPRKDPREHLRTFRLVAADGLILVSATDLVSGVTMAVTAEVREPGSVLLPWERAIRAAKEIPDSRAELVVGPESSFADLKTESFAVRLSAMPAPPEAVPQVPTSWETVGAAELRAAIDSVSWAACRDGIRRGLMQVLVGPVVAASDGRATATVTSRLRTSASIPVAAAESLTRFLAALPGQVEVGRAEDGTLWVRRDHNQFWSRPGPAKYPDIQPVLDVAAKGPRSAEVHGPLLRRSAESVMSASGSNVLLLQTSGGALRVAATDSAGNKAMSVLQVTRADDGELLLRAKHLVDGLTSCGDGMVTLRWGDAANVPVLMSGGGVNVLLLRRSKVTASAEASDE